MKRVTQPAGTHLCGQAVVAMLAGLDLEAAVELLGTRGRTTAPRLIHALQARGFRVDLVAQPRRRSASGRRIYGVFGGFGFGRLRSSRDRRWRHWFAFDAFGRVLDSWFENVPRDWPEGWYVTRLYRVTPARRARKAA